jgi:hypothetical protein
MIYIDRISKDKLSKVRFGFDLNGNTLQYVEHYTFNRDTVKEPWGDRWPKALSYDAWCKSHDLEPSYCECDHNGLQDQYHEYQEKMNPVCHRTKNGKSKMSGVWCMDTKVLPPCPDVSKEALVKYTTSLRVKCK